MFVLILLLVINIAFQEILLNDKYILSEISNSYYLNTSNNGIILSEKNFDESKDIVYKEETIKYDNYNSITIKTDNKKCLPECYINCKYNFNTYSEFKYCISNLCSCKIIRYNIENIANNSDASKTFQKPNTLFDNDYNHNNNYRKYSSKKNKSVFSYWLFYLFLIFLAIFIIIGLFIVCKNKVNKDTYNQPLENKLDTLLDSNNLHEKLLDINNN